MKILALEPVLANAVIGGVVGFANLWLLPTPDMVGTRIGIHADGEPTSFQLWFYRERLGLSVPMLRRGNLGTVLLKRVAEPGELGRMAYGPAVWVLIEPKIEGVSGRLLRAGYEQQPHVRERDKLKAAQSSQEGKAE